MWPFLGVALEHVFLQKARELVGFFTLGTFPRSGGDIVGGVDSIDVLPHVGPCYEVVLAVGARVGARVVGVGFQVKMQFFPTGKGSGTFLNSNKR